MRHFILLLCALAFMSPPGAKQAFAQTKTNSLTKAQATPSKTLKARKISGVMSPKYVAKGLPEHINIVFSGKDGDWVVNDTATVTPPDGYKFWYVMNGETVQQSGRLTNYVYKSNMPLGIYKLMVKDGTQNLWGWHGQGGSDESIGREFSHGSSVAFTTVVFNKR